LQNWNKKAAVASWQNTWVFHKVEIAFVTTTKSQYDNPSYFAFFLNLCYMGAVMAPKGIHQKNKAKR